MSRLSHPGTNSECAKCGPSDLKQPRRGYVVERSGDYAQARLCDCVQMCPKCRGLGLVSVDPKTFRSPMVRCDCRRFEQRLKRFNAAQIPARYAHTTDWASFSHGNRGKTQIFVQVYAYYKQLVEDPHLSHGLLLYGPPGTGKTHLVLTPGPGRSVGWFR